MLEKRFWRSWPADKKTDDYFFLCAVNEASALRASQHRDCHLLRDDDSQLRYINTLADTSDFHGRDLALKENNVPTCVMEKEKLKRQLKLLKPCWRRKENLAETHCFWIALKDSTSL